MIANKPSIFIYVNDPDHVYMDEICAGIEEEGVLYTLIRREEKDVSSLAYEAANDSMLGSGIGISGSEVAMQMKGLKKGDNVFIFNRPDKEECRYIGANSARAIKKLPFKIK
jgi:hypothetical protein